MWVRDRERMPFSTKKVSQYKLFKKINYSFYWFDVKVSIFKSRCTVTTCDTSMGRRVVLSFLHISEWWNSLLEEVNKFVRNNLLTFREWIRSITVPLLCPSFVKRNLSATSLIFASDNGTVIAVRQKQKLFIDFIN